MTAQQDHPGLIEEALTLAARGWYLLPVGAGRDGKAVREDLCPRWSRDSSQDPHTIVSWLAGAQHVGIAVDLQRSNLAVIDGDHLQHFDIPDTLLGGGWSYQGNRVRKSWMFTTSLDSPVPTMSWMPWGEVKGAGSYVIVPPSPHHTGVTYRWLDTPGDAPAVFPEAIRPYLTRPDEESAGASGGWDGQEATPEQAQEARSILLRQCRKVAATPRPDGRESGAQGRNQMLNRAAYIVGRRLWALGVGGDETAREWLLEAARRCGLVADDGELACRRSIRSGLVAGAQSPVQVTPSLGELPAPEVGGGAADGLLMPDGFWCTDVLTTVQQAAHSRHIGAAGLLGATLARVSLLTDRRVELPGRPNRGSLNLLVGLVAVSGGGKGSSVAVAEELLPAAVEPCVCGTHGQGDRATIPTGSGEGLLRGFFESIKVGRSREWRRDRSHVLIDVDEVETLLAISGRSGATIGPVLRSLWSGATAGFANSSADRRFIVDAGSYRVAMVAGVQPGSAGRLFDEVMGGTPQRFLWLPAHALDVPDMDVGQELPDWPGRLPSVQTSARGAAPPQVAVDGEVAREVALRRNRVARAVEERNPLDAHRDFLRLRVAALLARLHQEWRVSGVWWELAGMVMDLSDRVRDSMLATTSADAVVRAERAGRLDAVRAGGREAHEMERVARVARVMWRKVARDIEARVHEGEVGCPSRCAMNAPGGRYPKVLRDEGLEFALSEGWLVERDGRLHLGAGGGAGV